MCKGNEVPTPHSYDTLKEYKAADQQVGLGLGRQSYREALASRLQHAEHSACEAKELQRFMELADRHPEVLEMLQTIRNLNLY